MVINMSTIFENMVMLYDEMDRRIADRNNRLMMDIGRYYDTTDNPDLKVIEAMSDQCDKDIAAIIREIENRMGE